MVLNPQDDCNDFIDEFGVNVKWTSLTKIIDAQSGGFIESENSAKIRVILSSRSRIEQIMDVAKLDEEVLLMTCKTEDNVQVDDKITFGGRTYSVSRLADEPLVSDMPDELKNSAAFRQFEIIKLPTDG